MKTIAIINAGGTGSRFGHDTPKQYIFIDDKPMLYFSLKIFQDNKNINEIYVVSHKDYFEYITDICDKYNITKFVKCIEGGKTANESRYNGLLKLNNVNDDDIIIMHDAVRLTTEQATLNKLINLTLKHGYCVCGQKINANIFINSTDNFAEYNPNMPSNNVFVCSMPFGCKYSILKVSFDIADEYDELNNYAGPMGIVGQFCGINNFPTIELSFIETLKITYKNDVNFFNKMLE
jgi:2-C-methyl-D-erythritol 4-phosphate cytidylyltransferase